MELAKKALIDDKNQIRKIYRKIRDSIAKDLMLNNFKYQESIMKFSLNLAKIPIFNDLNTIKNFSRAKSNKEIFIKKPKALNIALYYPIKSEIDVLKIFSCLNKELNENSELLKLREFIKITFDYSLPVMTKERSLKFLEFKSEENLVENSLKIKEPNVNSSKEIIPDIIITPLLAFDGKKYRLGYGKGCYDSTFNEMKKLNLNFISIGIAYEEQFFEGDLPKEGHDCQLDYVITQDRIYF